MVLAELDHLVRSRLGADAARTLADDAAAGAHQLVALTPTDVGECVRLDRQCADLGLGLADASLVVLADQAGSRTLLTLDERHPRAVRPGSASASRLLPAST